MTANETVFANFTKLRDGTWGVRLPREYPVAIGDLVPTKKKNGAIETVIITAFDYPSSNKETRAWRFVRPGDNTHPLIAPDMPVEPELPAVPVIPSNRLYYCGKTRTFTAECSELYDVMPGACARLIVESSTTGNDMVFVLTRVIKDREGDIGAWEYLSAGDTGFKLTIFND